jgi:hypothetical protein
MHSVEDYFESLQNIDSCERETSLCHCIIRRGVNRMLTLKNQRTFSKLKSPKINSVKTYDFLTIYTTNLFFFLIFLFYIKLQFCFLSKNGKMKYLCLVIGHPYNHFVSTTSVPLTSALNLKSKDAGVPH